MKTALIYVLLCVTPLYTQIFAQNQCYEKAWTLYLHGQYEEALPAVKECINRDSADYRLFLLQGKIQENFYQYEQAIVSYSKALKLNENHSGIQASLAALYLKTGQTEIAAKLYARLVETQPEINRWKINCAGALQLLRKHKQALALLKETVATDSQNWVVYKDMGDCFVQLDIYDTAAYCYKKSLALCYNNKSVVQLMRIFNKFRKYEETIRTGRDAVKIDSTNAEIWKNLGLAYFFLNKEQNSILMFNKALELGDTTYTVASHLGFLYSKHDFEPAIKYLEIALRQQPDELATMYYLAKACEMGAEYDRSIALVDEIKERIRQFDSLALKAELVRADVFKQQKRYDDAIKVLSSVLKADPSQVTINISIATIYHTKLRNKKEAINWYSRYLNRVCPEWEKETKTDMQGYIKHIIESLKEDLFFEEEKEKK